MAGRLPLASGECVLVYRTDSRGDYRHIRKPQVINPLKRHRADPVLLDMVQQYLYYSVRMVVSFIPPQRCTKHYEDDGQSECCFIHWMMVICRKRKNSRRMTMRTLVCVMFLTTLFSSPGRCEFVMSVLEQPVSATAVMRGRVYGSTTDPRPNPCYGRSICEFTAALVKESDFNNSMRPAKLWGNGTFDTPKPAYFYPTIGEWWAAVYNKDVLIGTVLGTDGKSGYPACFALGASDKGSESAQPAVYISNCARVVVVN